MNIHELFTEERAVAPVVGVILMVAITVLLAATAATFFLGIGQDNKIETPQAAFDFEYDASAGHTEDALTVSHVGGDNINAAHVKVAVQDAEYKDGGSTHSLNDRWKWTELTSSSPSTISSGRSVEINRDTVKASGQYNELSLKGAGVDVVWDDPGSSKSFILGSWQS